MFVESVATKPPWIAMSILSCDFSANADQFPASPWQESAFGLNYS